MHDIQTDYRLLSLLSAEQAHHFNVIPAAEQDEGLLLWGQADSVQHKVALQILFQRPVVFEILDEEKLHQLLHQHYRGKRSQVIEVESPEKDFDSDVIRFVNKILQQAIRMEASDIHIERFEKTARVRYRWEGQLVEKYEVPTLQYNALVSRLKIMADLDIAEKRLPQDGRIAFRDGGEELDIRLSTLPAKFGEKIVMRLLRRDPQKLNLDLLGMSALELQYYREALTAPHGLILITGPTGSGKTTTLYASLKELNLPNRNLLTIEDPIEYHLTGINQVQLHEGIGLTFERALRAFLRQDPDVIMVGEIRDQATAEIAIRAALTGHLVFSTLHTNTARDAINRLKDMGIPPYLLAASLRMIVAQRLVRILCPTCKEKAEDEYRAVGCTACYFTGFQGRKGVYELLPIRQDIRQVIRLGEDLDGIEIEMPDMGQNLRALFRQGVISREEMGVYLGGG